MVQPLFSIFGINFYAHGFFLMVGLLLCVYWLVVESRRRKWPRNEVVPITLSAFVGGMVGARLSILFFNGWETAPVVLDFFRLFDPRVGPGSIMGGVVGAYLAGFVASRVIGKTGCACDAFAPAMALAMAVGRMGCFLSLEDGVGKPTGLPWGVWNGEYLAHPAALYDGAFNLLWFLILLRLRDHPWLQNGNLLKVGLAGYAIVRFFIEFTRNNRVIMWGLTGQQMVCVMIVAAVAGYFLYKRFVPVDFFEPANQTPQAPGSTG